MKQEGLPKKERVYPFDDPDIKKEMLELRATGQWSFVKLADKYGVDKTTIQYHCAKAGYHVFKDPVKIAQLVDQIRRKSLTIDQAASKFGVPRTVIEYHCTRARISGIVIVRPRWRPVKARKPKSERPGWMLNERNEWVSLGKSPRQRRLFEKERRKKLLEIRQRELLSY